MQIIPERKRRYIQLGIDWHVRKAISPIGNVPGSLMYYRISTAPAYRDRTAFMLLRRPLSPVNADQRDRIPGGLRKGTSPKEAIATLKMFHRDDNGEQERVFPLLKDALNESHTSRRTIF